MSLYSIAIVFGYGVSLSLFVSYQNDNPRLLYFPQYDSVLEFDFHLESEVLIMFKAVLEINEYSETDLLMCNK